MFKELDTEIVTAQAETFFGTPRTREDFQSPRVLIGQEDSKEVDFAIKFLITQNVLHYDESNAADTMLKDFPVWKQNMLKKYTPGLEESTILQNLTMQKIADVAAEKCEIAWDQLAVVCNDGGNIKMAADNAVYLQKKRDAARLAAKKEDAQENKPSAFKGFIEKELNLDGL